MNAPSIRCILLVDTVPGIEGPNGSIAKLLDGALAHYSVGFGAKATDANDHKAVATALRELADALEAPAIAVDEPIVPMDDEPDLT